MKTKFREALLRQVAPVSTNLILCYLAEHVLGMPRSYRVSRPRSPRRNPNPFLFLICGTPTEVAGRMDTLKLWSAPDRRSPD